MHQDTTITIFVRWHPSSPNDAGELITVLNVEPECGVNDLRQQVAAHLTNNPIPDLPLLHPFPILHYHQPTKTPSPTTAVVVLENGRTLLDCKVRDNATITVLLTPLTKTNNETNNETTTSSSSSPSPTSFTASLTASSETISGNTVISHAAISTSHTTLNTSAARAASAILSGACLLHASIGTWEHSLLPPLASLMLPNQQKGRNHNHWYGNWYFDVKVTPITTSTNMQMQEALPVNGGDEDGDEDGEERKNASHLLSRQITVGQLLWEMCEPYGNFQWQDPLSESLMLKIKLGPDDGVEAVRRQRADCVRVMEEANESENNNGRCVMSRNE